MAASDARPFPIKGVAYRVTLPILDADGDLVTGAAGLDSEISKDGGTFTDCTNEATEIATSSGFYYLDLTSTEMNADTVAVMVKTSTSGAKTTPIILYPAEDADIRVNLVQIAGAAVNTTAAQLGVNVVTIANNAITAASIATDAIDNDALAANAVTEIQSGLATAAALQTVDDLVDELETRLTAVRAGYLDNLSGGAVSTAAALATVAAYIDTEVAAILAAVDTEIAAIKAKTDNLPSDPADDSDIDAQLAAIVAYIDTEVASILAAVDTEVAAIKAKTDNLPASPAAVGSAMTLAANSVNAAALATDAVAEIQSGLSTLTAGQVNAEVVDALATDTYTEPSGVPAATASIAAKISFLTALARNKRLTTATTDKVRNDADTADIATATLTEDGTTFTRGEYA